MRKKATFTDPTIRLESAPELRFPVLFAAWPGMGNVALNAARYLVEKLDATPLANVDSSEYAVAEGVLVKNSIVVPMELPEYRFYYYRHPRGIGDLVLFVGESQPFHPKGYAMTRSILKLANWLGTRRVYTAAALACSISHMDSPKVWAVVTHAAMIEELNQTSVKFLSEGHISGLNGLILGTAKQMGFEGMCLLGELPYYTVGMDNPKSSLAVLEQLCMLLRIEVDLSDLREAAVRKEIEIEEFIRLGNQQAMLEEIMEKSKEGGTPQ